MKLIVICSGGGKTTLINNYPDLFLDIDDFVWTSHNTIYHERLSKAITTGDMNTIGNIYKTIMINNQYYLQTQSKIILGHNPIYSEWIGVKLLIEMKPSIKLHELNIANRTPELKRLSRQNWKDLDNAIIYDDWDSFNKLISKCVGYELSVKIDNI
jgi:hypothetical protein